MSAERLLSLLEEGVGTDIFPAAQAEVWLSGAPVFTGHVGNADADTVFDLASLTKIMSTTALFLSLWEEGRVTLETPVWRDVTVRDCLSHASGLPAFVPFFAQVFDGLPQLRHSDCPASIRAAAQEKLLEAACSVSPVRPRGTMVEYSDVGFILLGAKLEEILNQPLDEAFLQRIARPLGQKAHFRRLSKGVSSLAATTGTHRPRPPAPGQEGLWTTPSLPSTDRGVDDDNAFVMDGVAGHSGLFGTAHDVALFGQEVLRGLSGQSVLASRSLWEACVAKIPGTTRVLGFDTPSEKDASAGSLFSRASVGHLGFTGTSLWVDVPRQLVVALVSNRVFLGRDNQRIRAFRPRFHDEVVRAFSLS